MQHQAKSAAGETDIAGVSTARTKGSTGFERREAPTDAQVMILNLEDGATVTSPVIIKFGVRGMTVVPSGTKMPNSGHFHLLLDLDELPSMDQPLLSTKRVIRFGGGQTQTSLGLESGKHTLQLLFADYRHIPHKPALLSE